MSYYQLTNFFPFILTCQHFHKLFLWAFWFTRCFCDDNKFTPYHFGIFQIEKNHSSMPSPSPVVHRVNGVDLPPTSSPNSETPKSKLVNVQVCKIELKLKLRRCSDGARRRWKSRRRHTITTNCTMSALSTYEFGIYSRIVCNVFLWVIARTFVLIT